VSVIGTPSDQSQPVVVVASRFLELPSCVV